MRGGGRRGLRRRVAVVWAREDDRPVSQWRRKHIGDGGVNPGGQV